MIFLLLVAVAAAGARRHHKPDYSGDRLDALFAVKQELDLTDQSLLEASQKKEDVVAALVEVEKQVEQNAPDEVAAVVAPVEVAAAEKPAEPVVVAVAVEPVVAAVEQPVVVADKPSHDALMARAFDLLTKIDLAIAHKSTSTTEAAQTLVAFLEQLAELVSA
jgi:hypothetical protein